MDYRKAQRRDVKIKRRKTGMRIDGRSIFVIQEVERKKADEIRKAREEKEELLNVRNE